MPPPRARWLQLVCGVGDFVSTLREAATGEERYLPVRSLRIHVERHQTTPHQNHRPLLMLLMVAAVMAAADRTQTNHGCFKQIYLPLPIGIQPVMIPLPYPPTPDLPGYPADQ